MSEHQTNDLNSGDTMERQQPLQLLTVKEVAELLRVHQRTAYRLITGGSIHAIKIGSQWRVPEKSLMDFIESGWKDSARKEARQNESKPDQYKLPLE